MIIAMCPQNWFSLLLINTYIPGLEQSPVSQTSDLKPSAFVRQNVGPRVATRRKLVIIAPKTMVYDMQIYSS